MPSAYSHLLHGDRSIEWQARAACQDVENPDIFFPVRGKSSRPARELCESCPVHEECRKYGLMEIYGIWGGTTEKERRAIRRTERKAREVCKHGHRRTPGKRCVTCTAISRHESYLRRPVTE